MDSQRVSAAISLSNLPFTFDNPQMTENNSKRTSSASTVSSMPRTPSSSLWDRDDWRDSRYSPLIDTGAFQPSEYSAESDSTFTFSPATPFKDALVVHNDNRAEHQVGNYVHEQRPSHSRSISSPVDSRPARLSRSATVLSTVRPWPHLPPHVTHSIPEDVPIVSTLSSTSDENNESDSTSGGGSDSISDSTGKLTRRRHIKRPSRAQKEHPRPLPPLPASSLTHSQTTSGRFISLGTMSDSFFPSTSAGSTPPMADVKRRSKTITSFSGIRPLPNPTQNESIPTATTTMTAPIARQNGRRAAVPVPQLRVNTLALRSSPSDAAAVLTKTPNRTSHPSLFGRDFVPPPMPADASAQIDWDFLEEALGVEEDKT